MLLCERKALTSRRSSAIGGTIESQSHPHRLRQSAGGHIKTQKSAVEKAAGVHRDKIFTITVEVDKPQKGSGFKRGDKITVIAWQSSLRIRLPGLQGHGNHPGERGKRDLLPESGNGTYEPVHANAIQEDEG
ncbi:MAG: hypothetical protein R3F11_26700 [Verrucomicrobiales bacterium]